MTDYRAGWLKRLTAAAVAMALGATAQAAITASSVVRAYNDQAAVTWAALTISNPMSQNANCTITFQSYGFRSGGSGNAEMTLPPIPPGASRTINVPVPLMMAQSAIIREADGTQTVQGFQIGYGSRNYVGFMHVAEQSNYVTEDQMDDFTRRITPDGSSSYYGSGMSGGTTRSLSAAERNITQGTVADLPENWVCYVPLHSVIMNESVERGMSAPQRDALDTWIAAGGELLLYGGVEESTASLGAGSIIRRTSNPILDSGYLVNAGTSPLPIAQTLQDAAMPYKEVRSGGRNGAFALATLFLIIAGPVNYFYFSRRGQIRKLIVTVPAISIVFCLLIGIYFIATQGFQRKGGSMSVTYIDENRNHGLTLAKHSMLSGLYPLGGFVFDAATYFQPRMNDKQQAARFDLTKQVKLTDGLFQPGIPFEYSTMRPFTTRERMLYDGEKSEIRNGFEMPVKAVAVVTGGQYYLGGATTAGGVVKLKAVDATNVPKATNVQEEGKDTIGILVKLLGRQSLTTTELEQLETLAVQTSAAVETSGTLYAALLDGVPKTSDSGVQITNGQDLHLLIGAVETGEGAAK